MKLKKISALVLCLVMVLSMAAPAMAANPGVYTASVITNYYNPDTGAIDDGGTANAALGEGMCRSATGATGLVEVDANGQTWLTIRLLLQSNCSNVQFYTRTGYNTYTPAYYTVTAENSAADTIDYRFPVGYEGVYLKATMYVAPMGRDVLWYLYAAPGTMQAGSGDFTVCIDQSAIQPTPAPTPTPEAKPEVTPAPETEAPAPSKTPAPETSKEPEKTPAPETEKPEPEKEVETEDEEAAEPEEELENEEDVETMEKEEPEEESKDEEKTEKEPKEDGMTGGAIAGIVIAVLAVVGLAIYLVMKRKNK